MKITNNRSRAAWFHYKVDGMTKKVFIKGYETFNIPNLSDIDQTNHNRTISNFTGETTSIRGVKKVNDRKIGFDQQTDGNFEVEYTTT
jgi:hypothetical protein